MKRVYRRRRNREAQEQNKKSFFPKVNDNSLLSKKDKNTFFQTKLTISKKNDAEEKEADIAARNVVNKASKENPPEEEKDIQKQVKPEEEDKIRTKLNIQKQQEPEDEDKIQTKLNVQKQTEPEEEDKIQARQVVRKQERNSAYVKNREEKENRIQTKAENKNEVLNPQLSEDIEKTKGKGISLSPEILTEMEAFFKADFSKVIIHNDQTAAYMCRKLNARAFTNGFDIYFDVGQYDPTRTSGKELLAHELSHVVQQTC